MGLAGVVVGFGFEFVEVLGAGVGIESGSYLALEEAVGAVR